MSAVAEIPMTLADVQALLDSAARGERADLNALRRLVGEWIALREWKVVYGPDVDYWRRAFSLCTGGSHRASQIGIGVHALASEYHRTEPARLEREKARLNAERALLGEDR